MGSRVQLTPAEVWQTYSEKTDSIEWLKEHRDWVEQNSYGFGDRPLHYMWYELVKKLPDNATALEVGVYKGQTISLWGLIAKRLKKKLNIIGVTKLNQPMGDKYHTHEAVTQKDIDVILDRYGVKAKIIDTDSRDPIDVPELDLLYVDGGHDYSTVLQDISNFVPRVRVGGMVVFDDASSNLEDYGHWYKGLDDVSKAVDEFAQNHKEILRVGHNRCFEVTE